MENKLILVGGGEHCKAVIDIAEQAGREIVGILDTADKAGQKVLGYEIIGTDDLLGEWIGKAKFILTVGHVENAALRIKLHRKIAEQNGEFDTLISPRAYVSPHATLGEGTVVMHGAVVCAGVKIGKSCIINTLADIDHDATLHDFCHASAGAIVTSRCVIGEGTFLGIGSLVINGAEIAPGCMIGAGTVVPKKHLDIKGVYAGNPARLIKEL